MEFIKVGGVWYTVPILIMGLASVVLIAIVAVRAMQRKSLPGIMADTILFLGFLSLAWGIFGQVAGMFHAAGAVVKAGEISPSLIWEGLKISLIPVIMGFVVLFVSSIGWFVLRRISTKAVGRKV
jgi:hypothetical protein